MKIHELENAPQWLLDANTYNANVDIIDGVVHWYDGSWFDGTWHGGEWHYGVWHNGTWRDGEWHDGVWLGGTWQDGVWRGGRLVKVLNADLPPGS